MKSGNYTFEHVEAITSGDREALIHFVQLFFRETLGTDLQRLIAAKDARDFNTMSRAAHRMKTGLRMFGMKKQLDTVIQLELWEEKGMEMSLIESEVDQLKTELDEIQSKIRQELNL